MEKMQILIVEDEMILAENIGRYLNKLGYTVSAIVTTGEAALQKAQELQPDLVLMDIHLDGELDGVEAAEHIRTAFGIPMVYITGYADPETLERARLTEPYAYLLKPIKEIDLAIAIPLALYRHEMDRKLQESEARFQAFMQYLPGAAYIKDLDGRIVFCNAHFAALINQQPEALIGLRITEFLPTELAAQFEDENRQVFAKGAPMEFEHLFPTPEGPTYWLTQKFPVLAEGKAPLLGTISIDITGRKLTEAALQKLNDDLEERVEYRTEDLNNLVGAMAGREVRMAELKRVIKKLRKQLIQAGMEPVADDPLAEPHQEQSPALQRAAVPDR